MSRMAPRSPSETRVGRRALVLAALCAVVMLAGCSEPEDNSAPVDPQVLHDVIDATLMVPGPEMIRAMRVQQFSRNQGFEQCGGTPGPIDSTAGRFDQSTYAYLDLIREKGFTEDAAGWEEDERLAELPDSCDFLPNLAGWSDAQSISFAWSDVAFDAKQDETVRSHLANVAECLESRTGLDIDESNPINSYLGAADIQNLSDNPTVSNEDAATTYADCAQPYFDELRAVLLERRDDVVERHREALETYARSLVEAGYVP